MWFRLSWARRSVVGWFCVLGDVPAPAYFLLLLVCYQVPARFAVARSLLVQFRFLRGTAAALLVLSDVCDA